MTTTQTDLAVPTRSSRSWWPDQRPVQVWVSGTSLVVGLVLAVGTLVTGLVGVVSFDDTAFVMVLALGWIAQAGLEVARPRPGATSAVVYRIAYFGIPFLAATFAVALLLTL